MPLKEPRQARPVQSIPVYPGEAFCAVDGANLGDTLSFANDLQLDDVYALGGNATLSRLSLLVSEPGKFTVAPGSEVGLTGATMHLDSCVTLMNFEGTTTELLILVEVDGAGHAEAVYALPLSPLMPKTEYTLVGVSRDNAQRRFAQVACVSFSKGTRLTTDTGALVPIEELKIGDKLLTRDRGPQPVRWIGQTTMRAQGEFAPIVITKGTLNNVADLVVSPDHRLFIYQRYDRIGAGRSELLVKARYLVNDDTVYVQEGGFVEYYQLLFDNHEIIYAEGIAAETMLVDTRTRPALPAELQSKLTQPQAGLGMRPHLGYEVNRKLLDRPNVADLLKEASGRGLPPQY